MTCLCSTSVNADAASTEVTEALWNLDGALCHPSVAGVDITRALVPAS